MIWRALSLIGLALVCAGPASAESNGQPAELPPSDYAGQQYVDSTGCVFLRAGTEAGTIWVPRVTPGGAQVCGYPPSGHRVPVEGEPGAEESSAAPDMDSTATAEAAEVAVTPEPEADDAGTFFIAMGSFGFPSNVNKAVSAAEGLALPVVTGEFPGGEEGLTTVFVGPFEGRLAAAAALQKVQAAGYPDAILMKPTS